jgi:hypothetical protein
MDMYALNDYHDPYFFDLQPTPTVRQKNNSRNFSEPLTASSKSHAKRNVKNPPEKYPPLEIFSRSPSCNRNTTYMSSGEGARKDM